MSKFPNKDVVSIQSKPQNKSPGRNATQFQDSTAKKSQEKFPGIPRNMCQGTTVRRRKAPLEYFNQIILCFNGEWYQFFNMFANLYFCCNKSFDSKAQNSIIFGKFSELSLNLSLRQSFCNQIKNGKKVCMVGYCSELRIISVRHLRTKNCSFGNLVTTNATSPNRSD